MDLLTIYKNKIKRYVENTVKSGKVPPATAKDILAYLDTVSVIKSDSNNSLENSLKEGLQKFPLQQKSLLFLLALSKLEYSRTVLDTKILPNITQDTIDKMLDQVNKLMIP